MLRDLGGVSPTHVSGNGHRDFGAKLWTLQWYTNCLQAFLAMVWEPLENAVLDNHPWMTEALWKSRAPVEKFQKKKIYIYEFGCIGEGKRNNLTLPISLFPQCRTVQCQERPSLSYLREETECVSENLAFTDVQNSAKEFYFSLIPSRILSHDLHD